MNEFEQQVHDYWERVLKAEVEAKVMEVVGPLLIQVEELKKSVAIRAVDPLRIPPFTRAEEVVFDRSEFVGGD